MLPVVLAYANSFPGAFHYDDFPLLLENPSITADFPYHWFLVSYGGRPLTLWTFHLNYAVSGADPAIFHAVGLVLHLLATGLLYSLVYRVSRHPLIAVLASLFFSLHPLQTQALNYTWSRSVVLMAVFALGACVALKAGRSRAWVIVLAQAAIWSRAEALALLIPLWLGDRRLRPWLVVLAGLNLSSLVAGVVHHEPPEVGWRHSGIPGYWLEGVAAWGRYLEKMVWPAELSIFHGQLDAGGGRVVAVLLLTGLLAGLAWWGRSAVPELGIGLGWCLLWLSPSLLVPNADAYNESRAYLALAGVAFALAGTAGRVWEYRVTSGVRVRWAPFPAAVMLAWTVAMLPMTLERNRVWQDDVGIWEEAVRTSPAESLPRYNLGVALARLGRVEEAERSFLAGARLNPADDLGYAGLGFCAESRGQLRAAAGFYSHALNLNPGNIYAREALERVLVNLDLR